MEQTNYDIAKKILADYIRENHLRNTLERQLVLQQICAYPSAFSAEKLIVDLGKKEHISVATVYNTLDLFVKCRLLSKMPAHVGSPTDEYELVFLQRNHLTFFCTNCGREVPFQDRALEDFLKGKRFTNFNMGYFSLRVYGTCKKCRRLPLVQNKEEKQKEV